MAIDSSSAAGNDIVFEHVSKRFGALAAVDDVSFAIKRGAFHSFLGPSGCGKTTSLRLIAGFEQPSAGRIEIAGQPVMGIPAYRRPVNMVFQQYALFPHMDVAGNVGYGLRQLRPRPTAGEIDKHVAEVLELVRLPHLAERRIWELSGGQQQRVALARALINRPTVLLLDEPLAALDRKLRREMQMELQNLQREVGITFILVTHDQEEALSMSDTIGIMRDGRIVQFGSPQELYDAPVDRYVADFVGESNFIAGSVIDVTTSAATLRTAQGLVIAGTYSALGHHPGKGEAGVVAIRPEVIDLWRASDRTPTDVQLMETGTIRNRIYLGDHTEFGVETRRLGMVLVRLPKASVAATILQPGDAVALGWHADRALILSDK
ncbi:MAG TPA: ABC transporter ATP-binding protein [Dongiaceae bacterium]